MEAEKTERVHRRRQVDVAYILLLVALALAGYYVVKLSKDVAVLNRRINETMGTPAGPPTTQAGDLVPGFSTVGLNGGAEVLSYGLSSRTLVFIFSPGCEVCESEIPLWNKLAGDLSSDRGLKVCGISLEPLQETQAAMKENGLRFPVLIMPSAGFLRAYRVTALPEILLVSSDGTVQWVHYGGMGSDDMDGLLSQVQSKK